MRQIDKKQLTELKRSFTPTQKTLCKKFEQYGGTFMFERDGDKFRITFGATGVYTDFMFKKQKYNTGRLHKGSQVRTMDKWNKFNHEEYKVLKTIDNPGIQ
jgi:hypothetical protein